MTAGVASSNEDAGPRTTSHRAQTLSRTGLRDIAESQHRRDALFEAASMLRRAAEPAGLFAAFTDRDLSELIDALATEHDATVSHASSTTPNFDVAMRRFLAALDGAVPAVRTCRQTAHSVNDCWFLTPSTNCGDVLKCAHKHAG
ncbi:MAG: hypothetical protein WD360_07250 [Nitriliruptoraceae bacterium]